MIISAKVVKHPKWSRICEHCERDILGPQLKLYGAADKGEKPFNIYQHLDCGFGDPDLKIERALELYYDTLPEV